MNRHQLFQGRLFAARIYFGRLYQPDNESVITIEGQCFTDLGPDGRVDSTRTLRLTFGSAAPLTYDFQETEVSG